MTLYLDTSVLFKLYFEEDGTHEIEKTVQSAETILLSEIANLEFRSALFRRAREKAIDQKTALLIIDCFKKDKEQYLWIPLNSMIMNTAEKLLEKYGTFGLRTLDSIQLASALFASSNDTVCLTTDELLKKFMKEENLIVQL
jgi:predicted nucleic acid-binding protein